MKQMTFGSQNLISELHDVVQRTNSTKIVALKSSRFRKKVHYAHRDASNEIQCNKSLI